MHLPACWKISELRFVPRKCQPANSEGLLLLSFPGKEEGTNVCKRCHHAQPQGWIVPPLAPPWRQGKFCWILWRDFFLTTLFHFVVFKLTQVPEMIIVDYINLNDEYSYRNFRHHSATCGTSAFYLFCWRQNIRRRKPCGLTCSSEYMACFLTVGVPFGYLFVTSAVMWATTWLVIYPENDITEWYWLSRVRLIFAFWNGNLQNLTRISLGFLRFPFLVARFSGLLAWLWLLATCQVPSCVPWRNHVIESC